MRVLLFSMPDSFEHTPVLTMRMPNGALASLAGNAGPGHDVAVADLILVQDRVAGSIAGLSFRHPGSRQAGFHHTPARPVSSLDGNIELPNRAARVLEGYTFMGRGIDIVETSRGCTYDCSFCSIIEMRGRNFH